MLLPNYAEAVIPEDKLSGYCLNEEHPVGKDKAYLFRTLLNLTAQDSNWLRQQIEQESPGMPLCQHVMTNMDNVTLLISQSNGLAKRSVYERHGLS